MFHLAVFCVSSPIYRVLDTTKLEKQQETQGARYFPSFLLLCATAVVLPSFDSLLSFTRPTFEKNTFLDDLIDLTKDLREVRGNLSLQKVGFKGGFKPCQRRLQTLGLVAGFTGIFKFNGFERGLDLRLKGSTVKNMSCFFHIIDIAYGDSQ